MDVSKRIEFIIENLEKVDTLADIGTDHGYVPLIALEREICEKAIACDINKDPLDKARLNAILEGFGDELQFRLGGGFEPLNINEANEVVIAGMGGNLIRDILEADREKVKSIDYLILVPAQNPEVLREYLYTNNYEIIKEDLCFDEGIYNYNNLEVHHIEKLRDDKTKLLDNDNLICLCRRHHIMADKGTLNKDYLYELVKNREDKNKN